MANRGNILLVSGNPEAHRTLELVASTYNLGTIGAENARKGINLIKSLKPDCIIFDFDLLTNQPQRVTARKKLEESGIPTLFLNDNRNGSHPKSDEHTPFELESVVRFVVDARARLERSSNGRFLSRLPFLGRFRRA